MLRALTAPLSGPDFADARPGRESLDAEDGAAAADADPARFSGGAAVHRGGRTLDPHFQFLAAAGFDPLVDQGLEYAKALAAAGVPFTYRCYDSLPHGFVSFTTVPAARAAVRQIALLMRERYDQL